MDYSDSETGYGHMQLRSGKMHSSKTHSSIRPKKGKDWSNTNSNIPSQYSRAFGGAREKVYFKGKDQNPQTDWNQYAENSKTDSKSQKRSSLLFPDSRARSPVKEGPQPRGFSAPGAVGSCPPVSAFANLTFDDDEQEFTKDAEMDEFLRWKERKREGRLYTFNQSYQRNIGKQDVRQEAMKQRKPKRQIFKTKEELENDAYNRSYVHKKKSRPKRVGRRHLSSESSTVGSDDDTIVLIDNNRQEARHSEDSTSDSDDHELQDMPNFNPTSNPGPPQYYRLFPRPWNVVPDYESPKDAKLLNTILSSHLIPKMKDTSHLAYIAWRGGFISNVHRMNCPLHTKIQAMIALMSEQVKERVGKITAYTPQNYLHLVRRLEEKLGSPRDLVREMTSNIKNLKQLKVGKITDLEKYEQAIEEYISALKTADRRRECKAENTLQQIIQPLPMYYQNQYQEYLNQTGHRDHALSLHRWVRIKIQDMISVHRRRGRSPDHDDSKKNFVNVASVDKKMDQNDTMETQSKPDIDQNSDAADDGSTKVDLADDMDEYEDSWYSFLTAPRTESKVCKLCSKPAKEADHYMRDCPLMLDLPESANRAIFKEFGLCFKCGRADGHGAKQCTVAKGCKKCDSKFHHTLLHNHRKKQ